MPLTIFQYCAEIRRLFTSEFIRTYQPKTDDKGRGFDNGRKTCMGPEEAGLCSVVQLIGEMIT